MSAQVQPKIKPVPLFARQVSRDLENWLYKAHTNTTLHWVAVAGESSLRPRPQILWPATGDPMFAFHVQKHGEGITVYVMAQNHFGKPADSVPVLILKFLCGMNRMGDELMHLQTYFSEIDSVVERLRLTPERD